MANSGSEEIDELESDDDQDTLGVTGDPKEDQGPRLMSVLKGRELVVERLRRSNRLPFVLEHLVEGFRSYVQRSHPSAAIREDCPGYKINYYMLSDEDNEATDAVFQGEAWTWSCPLCRLFDAFRSRAELNVHLVHGHEDFRCAWAKDEVGHFLTDLAEEY